MDEFKKKYGPWALIIGASQGLGAAFAENCAKCGINVAICARTQNKLDSVAKALRDKYKIETRQICADIMVEDCAKKIDEATSDLDIGFYLFNAAGVAGGQFIEVLEEDHLKNIVSNCITPTLLTLRIAKRMVERKSGGIYLVSSMAGERGISNWVSYGASKGYEMLLGEGLWYELKKHGIDAGTYVVGSTETPEFKDSQEKHGTGLTGSSQKKSFFSKNIIPISPDAVAEALFNQIGKGPKLFSKKADRTTSKLLSILSRKKAIQIISSVTEQHFHGGNNELTGSTTK